MIQPNFALFEFFKTNQGLVYECELLADFSVILRNIIYHRADKDYPLSWYAQNIIDLSEYLQEFRNAWNLPIKITSGFRTAGLNYVVGGVENSKHLVGRAADITWNGYTTYKKPIKNFGTPTRIIKMCEQLQDAKNSGRLSELVFYENYVHIAI